VKGWRDSFLLDLESLPVPSYVFYDTSDSENTSSLEDSSEEDSNVFISDGLFIESDNEESRLSSTDDDDVNITSSNKCMPIGPLIVHHQQVLEPSHIVKVLPGIPIQMRHKSFRLCGDNIDKSVRRRH